MAFTTQLHSLKDGRQLAVGMLDDTPALNALSHAMASEMLVALDAWRRDERIVAVLLRGGGEKHFCAGGNVHNVVRLINAQNWAEAGAYFYDEYHLDATLQCFPKPLIGWGNGALMGGGMGVFQGCDVRLVTPNIKMAMPEVHIGLFPDAGAVWFMRRCPPPLGLFLGLVGATLNAHDACHAGLADAVVPQAGREEFIRRLIAAEWHSDHTANIALAQSIATELATESTSETPVDGSATSALAQAQADITAACQADTVSEIMTALQQSKQPWLQAVMAKVAHSSPAARVLWHRYWHTFKDSSMAEAYAADYRYIMAVAREGEFAEGVRALLIDKDHQPRWRYAHTNAVPLSWPPLCADDDAAAERLAACIGQLQATD